LYRQLDVPHGVSFAFPAAPVDLAELLGRQYAGARAWWMIDPATLDAATRGERPDRSHLVPEGLVEARAAVQGVLDELSTLLEAKPEQTILGGFSQGAMLSLDVALHRAKAPAGVILMSGTLIARDEWQPLLPKLHGVPVLQSHGRTDPLLGFGIAERLRDLLKGAGADVRWVEFAGGHTIPNGVLDGASALIRQIAG
jgi:phospholipase/carboxylesterase